MGGHSSGSGFNWQGAISGLMKLAGAGITANRGVLGPVLLQAGEMMDQNQAFKRLRSLATEGAVSIRGTPEEEQLQNLIRTRELRDSAQIERLVEAGRGTQATLALPSVLRDVTTEERIPTPLGTIAGTPADWKDLRDKLAPQERPGQASTTPTLTVTPDERRTVRRPVTREEALSRAEQIDDPAVRARVLALIAGGRFPETDQDEPARRQFQREVAEGRFELTTPEGLDAARRRAYALGVPDEYGKTLTDVSLRKEMAVERRKRELATRHESDIEALSKRPGFKESFADELRSAVGDEKGYEARRRSVIQAIDRQATFDRQQEREATRLEATRAEKDETKRRQSASRELGYLTARMSQIDREFRLAEQTGDRVAMQQLTDEIIRLQDHAAQFEAILSGQAGLPEAGPPVWQLGPGGQPQLVP